MAGFGVPTEAHPTHRPKHPTMVGDGHGVHPHGFRMLRKLIQMASPVKQRELSMKMKMNELGSR